jgi:hypothetical protein
MDAVPHQRRTGSEVLRGRDHDANPKGAQVARV